MYIGSTHIYVYVYIEMPTAIFNFHLKKCDLAQNEIPIFVFKS